MKLQAVLFEMYVVSVVDKAMFIESLMCSRDLLNAD